MDLPDPIQDAEARFAQLDAADAERALAAANENRQGLFSQRSLGFAVIDGVSSGYDDDYRVLVTDGTRHGVIVVRLTGTLVASLAANGEDAAAHLLHRLQGATGSIRNDQDRWATLVLQPQPLTFSA